MVLLMDSDFNKNGYVADFYGERENTREGTARSAARGARLCAFIRTRMQGV